jgi:hypothetical protein
MDPRRSTAKRSGACGNISRGKKREQLVSKDFHQKGLGVLIAPIVLRSRGMGQCDLVRFLPLTRCVEVLEIKGGESWVSYAQSRRLREAGTFIGKILGASVVLRSIGLAGVCKESQSPLTF